MNLKKIVEEHPYEVGGAILGIISSLFLASRDPAYLGTVPKLFYCYMGRIFGDVNSCSPYFCFINKQLEYVSRVVGTTINVVVPTLFGKVVELRFKSEYGE